MKILTVEDLAAFLHKSIASIRSDATRNPQSLPPICRLPGTKRLLWRSEDVEQWLARYVTSAGSTDSKPAVAHPLKRKGRPTKAEQLTRLRSQVAQNSEAHGKR